MVARHIIVEGMDGSGKDTLIRSLKQFKLRTESKPHFVLRDRASTSLGGPVANLSAWVDEDLATMAGREPSIYNRHPLISELIYAPVLRHLTGKFQSIPWVRLSQNVVANHCIVIFCHPPFPTITQNLEHSGLEQMPGVVKQAHQLYRAYATSIVRWRGPHITYDYTKSRPRHLHDFIRNHITGGNA